MLLYADIGSVYNVHFTNGSGANICIHLCIMYLIEENELRKCEYFFVFVFLNIPICLIIFMHVLDIICVHYTTVYYPTEYFSMRCVPISIL